MYIRAQESPFTLFLSTPLVVTMLRTILWIWLVTEILFGMYFLQRRKHLQASATPPKLTRNERQALFETCVQTVNDIESYLSGWFYYYYNDKRIKPPLADIYRGNLAQWLAWALWMDDITHLSDKEQQHLSDMIDLLERRFSVTFRPGVNYLVGCIRPNLDPVEAFYRPLVIYLAIYSLRFAFTRYLVLMKGFKRVSLGCLVYYTHTSPCQRATPLVFVHGLGLGLTCYATLIHALHRIQRPIYLVELPFIIIRLHQGRAPSPETLVHAIEAMLDRHAHPKAVILAHSLGTVITSWVALKAPQRLAGMVLVDPVCFLLNYHHIAYNILHRVPQRWIEVCDGLRKYDWLY